MEGDSNYFSRRATEERIAAMKAADLRARRAHLKLAESYKDRANPTVVHELPVIEKIS